MNQYSKRENDKINNCGVSYEIFFYYLSELNISSETNDTIYTDESKISPQRNSKSAHDKTKKDLDVKCQLKSKSVKFSNVVQVILEPENLREDLQKARTSDVNQRQADKARRERLLSPILTKSHRANIFNKLHSWKNK